MIRLLLLLSLLLMTGVSASSEETEGSTGDDSDDEDLIKTNNVIQTKAELPPLKTVLDMQGSDYVLEKTTGVQQDSDQVLLIVVVVAISVVALSIAAVVAVVLVRCSLSSGQQGIYSVPTEQGQKMAV